MGELSTLPNIGEMLEAGIATQEELRSIGTKRALEYRRSANRRVSIG